ncbi:MAG: DUF1573 domain-containing protein [Tannerella sp.]|jgi:hypothetical protein|nr:DUF1573 domain-containing protein [Tannerella sp.]
MSKNNFQLSVLLFSVLIIVSCHSKKNPELVLSVENYDFGNVRKDSIYKGNVIITNSGNAPLIIDNINPGCGCTSVSVTKNIIPPKDTCLLNFSYNTHKKKGIQENFITLIANTDSLVHILQINAYVE